MAIHKSALKRHRQSLRRRTANRVVRSRVGTVVRRLREAIAAGDSDTAKRELVAAESILGSARAHTGFTGLHLRHPREQGI